MRKVHETFIALAAQLHSIHDAVKVKGLGLEIHTHHFITQNQGGSTVTFYIIQRM